METIENLDDSLLISSHQLFSKATRFRFGVANGCSLAIRLLGELANNFLIVVVDLVPKEELEGKLRAVYRLGVSVVHHDQRASTKRSRQAFDTARSGLVGEHALVNNSKGTRSLGQGGKGVGAHLVHKAHSL